VAWEETIRERLRANLSANSNLTPEQTEVLVESELDSLRIQMGLLDGPEPAKAEDAVFALDYDSEAERAEARYRLRQRQKAGARAGAAAPAPAKAGARDLSAGARGFAKAGARYVRGLAARAGWALRRLRRK
jgi:hypothetical protein